MQNLVIVESPTKARTLAKFLGKKYQIEASMGHVSDLPKSELGVDIENNFEPRYIVPRDKKKKANELKKLAKEAKQLWLATDPDREGEAIAWHLKELMVGDESKSVKGQTVHRVVFHEITESAIKDAFEHPRDLDYQLIDAQQARRVLDRLVGYKLSPLLWKKVKRGLSAGRVQSVALRLITEREREITAFKADEYWLIEVELETSDVGRQSSDKFFVSLIEKNGQKLKIVNEKEAKEHVSFLTDAKYQINAINKKEVRRFSPPPFTTSTLQQTAGNRLGYTAKRTMMLAQNLYEHGFITYMRTDSFNLAPSAIDLARGFIETKYGKKYLPSQARVFKSRSKNAQEAHEAIRPTNPSLSSEKITGEGLTRDHKRLYELIWKRMLASQMIEATLDQTSIEVEANSDLKTVKSQAPLIGAKKEGSSDSYNLRATGSVLKFDGWLKIYGVDELEEESTNEEDPKKQILPELHEKEKLDLVEVLPSQHFTQPPPRYTEASLIKKLEELGIGRPSTYAPILSTITERFYVEREERKFIPTALGFAVADFLVKYFPDVFDYAFTALMEDQLDEISRGEREWRKTIGEFYSPLEKKLEETAEVAKRVELPVEVSDKDCPNCGKKLIVRAGRFGKFLACPGFPECKHTESIEEKIDMKCPDCGGDIVVRRTKRKKAFYGCKNWPECKFASWTKPK